MGYLKRKEVLEERKKSRVDFQDILTKEEVLVMKKSLLVISMMAVFAGMTGCATSGDLAKLEAQQQLLAAKADQAAQEAQAAKKAADAATARADEAEKRAAERERIADEKAAKADAAFQRSMRK
jgi:murein lipoprotein